MVSDSEKVVYKVNLMAICDSLIWEETDMFEVLLAISIISNTILAVCVFGIHESKKKAESIMTQRLEEAKNISERKIEELEKILRVAFYVIFRFTIPDKADTEGRDKLLGQYEELMKENDVVFQSSVKEFVAWVMQHGGG